MRVGDEVFVYNRNHRVYDDNGWTIYRGHFVKRIVVGETEQSWLVGYDITDTRPTKYAKSSGKLLTARMVEGKVWIKANRIKIRYAVGKCNNSEVLMKIRELLEKDK